MNFIDSASQKIYGAFRKLKENNDISFEFMRNIIFQRWMIALFLSVGLSIILAPRIYESHPQYRHGMIAHDNIKADRDFLVEDTNSTRQKRNEAADAVRTIYDFDAEMAITLKSRLTNFYSLVAERKDYEQFRTLAENSLKTTFSKNEYALFKPVHLTDNFQEKLNIIVASFYEKNLVVHNAISKTERDKGITIVNLQTRVEENLKDVFFILPLKDIDQALRTQINAVFQSNQPSYRRTAFMLLKKVIEPNLRINREATDRKKAAVMDEVKPVYFQVQKNEMIVREGEKIGHAELAKLEAFHKTISANKFSSIAVLLGIFFTALFLTLLLYFWRTRNWLKNPARSNVDFLLFAIVALLQIFFVKAGIFIAVAVNRAFPGIPADACYFAIPFAWGAMIIAVLVNRNMSLIMTVLCSFLISLLFDEKMLFPLFAFLGSVAASYHIVNSRQRSTFLKVGIFLGVVNMAAIFCLNLLSGNPLNDLFIRLAMGFAGGVV
ncbi:MAG: hypothetical protein R6W75_08140, partial [Smithellaceae bacterium]